MPYKHVGVTESTVNKLKHPECLQVTLTVIYVH